MTTIDPKMAAVLDELGAVLKKHECGGTVVVVSREQAAWRITFPEWSTVYPEADDRMRVRLTSKNADLSEASLHALLSMRDIARACASKLTTMSQAVLSALQSNGVEVDHRNQAEEQ